VGGSERVQDSGDSSPLGRRFWTLWTSFTASNLGDGLSLVAFPLLAVNLTDDARLVAAVAAARYLPFLVVGLPAGVLIDRFDRRRIAMAAQLVRSLVLLGVIAAIVGDAASIALLAGGGFIVGVAEVMIDGGLPAVVRDVVESRQLEVANSRLRASETVTNTFIGPPIGALLFQLDPAIPFIGAVVLYLASIVALVQLPGSFVADADPDGDASFVDQIKKGLRYVWGHRVLRPLALAVAAFSFAGNAIDAVFVILATERLGLSELQYGLLISVDAIAAFAMTFVVTRIVKRTSHGVSMQISVVAFTCYVLLLGLVTSMPFVILAILLAGVSDPTWNVISATVRQRLVDDHIFGRMMTAYLFIAWSLQPVGAMVGGLIAERWGPQWVYLMAGAIVGSLLLFARTLFHRVDEAMQAIDA